MFLVLFFANQVKLTWHLHLFLRAAPIRSVQVVNTGDLTLVHFAFCFLGYFGLSLTAINRRYK